MLDETQEALLIDLVEADRHVPRNQRQAFMVHDPIGSPGMIVFHPGWLDKQRRVPEVDLKTLASVGLLQAGYSGGDTTYFVTPDGFARYAQLKEEQGEPIARVQKEIRTYIDSERFKSRHPAAWKKWQEAEELLWKDDSERSFTMIGHLCREAMQQFASSLLRHQGLTPRNPDPAKIIDRIRQFLESRTAQLGASRAAFLDSLLALWGTVSDLAHRQEHGAQKEGPPLGGKTVAYSSFTSWS